MRLIDADEVIRGYEELRKSPCLQESPAMRDGADCIIDLCVKSNSGRDNTIDPVKHGRWEQPEEIDVEEGAFRCNVCGATFCLINGTPEENQYFYCPACGARMDADE